MTLDAAGISFAYRDVPVLDDVSFTVPEGSVTALFGPNGTGKSTLFRCILGQLPHQGDVRVDGRSAKRWSARRMAREVALVPQDHRAAFPHSVRDMVVMGTAAAGASLLGPSRAELADALRHLARVDLLALADRSFTTLSGGQRQLVLIARALAQNTPYLLLDEPTASLDFGNQTLIWDTIRELAHEHGKGVLVCSHDPNHVLWFCDEAITLRRDGTIGRTGAVRDVITQDALSDLYPGRSAVTAVGSRPVVFPAEAVRR